MCGRRARPGRPPRRCPGRRSRRVWPKGVGTLRRPASGVRRLRIGYRHRLRVRHGCGPGRTAVLSLLDVTWIIAGADDTLDGRNAGRAAAPTRRETTMSRTPQEIFAHHAGALIAGDLDGIVADYTGRRGFISRRGSSTARTACGRPSRRCSPICRTPSGTCRPRSSRATCCFSSSGPRGAPDRRHGWARHVVFTDDGIRVQTVRYTSSRPEPVSSRKAATASSTHRPACRRSAACYSLAPPDTRPATSTSRHMNPCPWSGRRTRPGR